MSASARRTACALSLVGLASVAAACRYDGISDLVRRIPEAPASTLGKWMRAATCPGGIAPSTFGHVAFASHNDDHIHVMEARAGAGVLDVSAALDATSKGVDGFINIAPGGEWLLVDTTRLGCGDDLCLALVTTDLCSAQLILSIGETVHSDGTSAVGVDKATGDVVVVYPGQGGPHARDLFLLRRHGSEGDWGYPLLLTEESPHRYVNHPAISADGASVLVDCGPDPGSESGTGICEVPLTGTGFRTIMMPEPSPPRGTHDPENRIYYPDYEPAGGLVFEATWTSGVDEQIWHLPSGATQASLVNVEITEDDLYRFNNDNTPCALPDGRIVSLWLGRIGSNGFHELKLMNADGSNAEMLLAGENTIDIGIGCGQ